MNGLLTLHRLACERRDGLHPILREALETRERLAASAPCLVDIATGRDNRFVQDGPNPAQAMPEQLPPNVVRLEPGLANRAALNRKSATSSPR